MSKKCNCDCVTKTDLKLFFGTSAVVVLGLFIGLMSATGMNTSINWYLTPSETEQTVHQPTITYFDDQGASDAYFRTYYDHFDANTNANPKHIKVK